MKCAIFENLSTTTKMESLPCFDLGKPKTKSIKMSTHGSFGIGKEVYKPCGWVLDFAFLQVMHLSHMHCWNTQWASYPELTRLLYQYLLKAPDVPWMIPPNQCIIHEFDDYQFHFLRLLMCREWFEKLATMNLTKMDERRVWLVVFLLVFRLNYSDFKVNKMENGLEWYFDKSIWTPQRSI